MLFYVLDFISVLEYHVEKLLSKIRKEFCLMKRMIRPAEEEFGGIIPVILFSILWYCTIGGIIIQGGFQLPLLIFLIAGILPVFQSINNIRRALFYRRQRADAIALGNAAYGTITGVTRQDVPYYTSGEHRRLRYRRYYYLTVQMTDSMTGMSSEIRSQGYLKPIHRYLSSPQVKIYTDQSGWKHYLEDFQWKQHRSDPDIFSYPREFEEVHIGTERFGQIIFVIILILMIITMFRQ